jgi:hypothetical protein
MNRIWSAFGFPQPCALNVYGCFIDNHEHTISWNKPKYDTQLGGYITYITQEQLTDTSVVCSDEKDWWDRRREQDLHDHWKVPPYWGW